MKKFTLITLILLTFGLLIQPATGSSEDQIMDTEILSILISPQLPQPGDPINITVLIQKATFDTIQNMTLYYSYNTPTLNMSRIMQSTSIATYNANVITSINTTSIYFVLKIYVDNAVEDSSDMMQIIMMDVTFPIFPGIPIELPVGNTSISDDTRNVIIDLNIASPVNITVDIDYIGNFADPPSSKAVSSKITITVNDTTAISDSTLRIKLSIEKINEIKASNEFIILSTRESDGDDWQEYPSVIKDGYVMANTTHFSEWVASVQLPKLRFLDVIGSIEIGVKQIFNANFILQNFGGIPADNTSITIFLPKQLLLNNLSNSLSIIEFNPLENKSIIWSIFAESPGEYNLVITASADNAEGDLIEVLITVLEETTTITQSDTTSVRYFTEYAILVLIISVSLKKSKHRYK